MKRFLVRTDGYDDHYVEAETRAKAVYKVFLSANDAMGWSFHDVLIRVRVTLAK